MKISKTRLRSPEQKNQVKHTNKNNGNSYSLTCLKHQNKLVEKVCIMSNCDKDVLMCSECSFEQQQHLGLHKDYIMQYADFIDVCKNMSLKNKNEFGQDLNEKQFNQIVSKIETQILKYKNHLKKEEEKIDQDFNLLIGQFLEDVEGIKNQLKMKLSSQLSRFQELGVELKQKAFELNVQRSQNKDYTNDFDSFLKNVSEIQQEKPSQSVYNFKKLLNNITPLINKMQLRTQKSILSSNNQSPTILQQGLSECQQLAFPEQQLDAVSHFSGFTLGSNFTLSSPSLQYLAPLKGIFYEFRDMVNNKPFYRNKGEANNIYRSAFADARKIYYSLGDIVNDLIVSPSIRQSTQKEKQKAQVGSDKKQDLEDIIEEIDKFDVIQIKKDEEIKTIDHLKTINTSHKQGIFCLKIIDAATYVTGSSDKTLKVWSLVDNSLIKEVKLKSDATCIGILPRRDGSQFLLVGQYKGFVVLNQSFDQIKRVDSDHEGQVHCIVGLKDGESVITASSDPKFIVQNIFNNEILPKKYFEHKDTIYALEQFPSQNFVATAGKDRSIKVWRLQFYKDFRNQALEKLILDLNIPEAHKSDVTALRSCQEYPEILISGSASGEIKLWDINEGKVIKSFKNYSGWVYKIICFEKSADTQNISPLQLENNENAIPGRKQNQQLILKRKIQTSFVQQQHCEVTSPKKATGITTPNKSIYSQLCNISFLTASFDGTLKVWEGNANEPKIQSKINNLLDCYPFGGVSAIRVEKNECIQLMTTGNKGDTMINLWALK